MTEKQRQEEHSYFLKADKWLRKNGTFIRKEVLKEGDIFFRFSFQNTLKEPALTVEGADLVKLTISLFEEVST